MFWDFFNISLWDERESTPVSPGRVQQRFPGPLPAAAGSGPAQQATARTGHTDRSALLAFTSSLKYSLHSPRLLSVETMKLEKEHFYFIGKTLDSS